MKLALVAIAQNENRYLKEWIDYYINLSIDHIYIYDNNYIDGEDIQQLIDDLNYNDIVTIINVKIKSQNDIRCGIQKECYEKCYYDYGDLYDYMMFFDIDEFFAFTNMNFHNIKEYIQWLEEGLQFDQIHIPWVIYGDNNKIFYEDEPVQKRFKHISEQSLLYYHKNNQHQSSMKNVIKSIVKTKLNVTCLNPHTFISKDENNELITIDECGYFSHQYWSCDVCEFYNAHIKHYWSKSLEEYIDRRTSKFNFNYVKWFDNQKTFDEAIEEYFLFNEKTYEKLRYIELRKKLLQYENQ